MTSASSLRPVPGSPSPKAREDWTSARIFPDILIAGRKHFRTDIFYVVLVVEHRLMETLPRADLRRQLDLIEPSVCQLGILLYPCSAELRDGTVLKCVYFVDSVAFRRLWGRERPEEVPGKRGLAPSQVAWIREASSVASSLCE